jgi:hypothetical protein
MFALFQIISSGKLVFTAISVITIASLIAATILGWVAVGQIRRSSGKLHGMGLAVFAGLFLPLLALDFVVGLAVFTLVCLFGGALAGARGVPSSILVLLLSLPVIALLDVMIVRYVWRKVNPASGTPPLMDGSRQSGGSSILRIFALGCAGIIGLVVLLVLGFVALRFAFMPRSMSAGPQPHMMFSWASILLVGIVLVVLAAVVGLVIFLSRKKTAGTGGALAVGCGVAALAGVVLLVLLAGGLFWSFGSERVVVQNHDARQQQEQIENARGRAEQQMAEARARAEEQMAESRARAAQQAQPAQPTKPFFRIESSRSLNQADARERRIHFMRLDNSAVMTLRRMTNTAEFQPDEFAWMRKQFVDVRPWFTLTNQHIQEAGLESVDMLVAKISPAYPNAWGAITPEAVLGALREEAKSWPYPTATRTLTMRDNAGQSIAWAFRTRNGDQGVLQITSFSENPNSVSIRYKLLSPVADDSSSPDNSPKSFKPIPIEAAQLVLAMDNLKDAPAFAGKDLSEKTNVQAFAREIQKMGQRVKQLVRGTEAEAAFAEQEALQEKWRQEFEKNGAASKALNDQLKAHGDRLKAMILQATNDNPNRVSLRYKDDTASFQNDSPKVFKRVPTEATQSVVDEAGEDAFQFMTNKAAALIFKYFPNARMVAATNGAFAASHSLTNYQLEYQIPSNRFPGDFKIEWAQPRAEVWPGPSADGFSLTFFRSNEKLNTSLASQARREVVVTPGWYRRFYYSFDSVTSNAITGGFDYGPKLNESFKVEIFTLLKLGQIQAPTNTFISKEIIAADLKARLNAANSIVAFTDRDEVLAAIAADAARAEDLVNTRTALQRITAFTTRDEAIVNCARQLVMAGRRNDALELAKLVTAFTTRGDLIKELAK